MISRRRALTAVILWLLIFAVFVALTGEQKFVSTLSQVSAVELAVILAAVSVGVITMGGSLFVISRHLDIGVSLVETIFLNTSVSLAHNLTPFGQAGGAPIGAVVLSDRSGDSYEKCLAAISVKDIVGFVPSILIFTIGGTYLVVFEQSVTGRLRQAFAVFTVFVFLVVVSAILVRQYPDRVRRYLHRFVALLNRTVGQIPRIPSLDETEIERRVDNFSDSVGNVSSDRKTIFLASLLATASFLAKGCQLWLALRAVGVEIPLMLAIFIYPTSLLASAAPTPGGSGAIEGIQIGMILAATPAGKELVIPAVTLSRGLIYWTPIVLGSITISVFQLEKATDRV